jgi:regulator of sigma D
MGVINIKHEVIFKEFCRLHGYSGSYSYNQITNEYEIILTMDDNNAGAALTDDEYLELTERQLGDILTMLHMGFQTKFEN